MEINNCQSFRHLIRMMGSVTFLAALFCLLAATSGMCMGPHPDKKQANELTIFRKAGLTKDRSLASALIIALKNPPERFYTFVALHALAQMGATEALPAINALLATSHDTGLVNYAITAKARLLAESGAQAIKDPKVRAQVKLAMLYQQTGLTPNALNAAAKEYQVFVGTPGTPVPIGVCLMREAADVLYQEGVASSAVEAAPPDYSLDPASALKVRMAPLSPKERINALIEQLANMKTYMPSEPYAIQLLADMGLAAEQAVDAKLVDMDLHQEQYDGLGFRALFDVLRGIGDASQTSLVQDFARDPTREAADAAAGALADVSAGRKLVLAMGY